MEQFIEVPHCCLTCQHCNIFLSNNFIGNSSNLNSNDTKQDTVEPAPNIWYETLHPDVDLDLYCVVHKESTYIWKTCKDFEA